MCRYFKDRDAHREGEAEKGTIGLIGGTVTKEPLQAGKFIIGIYDPIEEREYRLAATTEEEQDEWLSDIKSCCTKLLAKSRESRSSNTLRKFSAVKQVIKHVAGRKQHRNEEGIEEEAESLSEVDSVQENEQQDQIENIFMEGYLEKRGGGNFSSDWRKRFFVLFDDQLRYFKDRAAFLGRKEEQGVIFLKDADMSREDDPMKIRFNLFNL